MMNLYKNNMSKCTTTIIFFFTFLILSIRTLCAHEFWIEPSNFQAELNDRIDVQIFVGEPFRGEKVVRNPLHFSRFQLVNNNSELDIIGLDGKDPAGLLRIKEAGLHFINYVSRQQSNYLEAEEFEDYLIEDGLERIKAIRKQDGTSDQPGRELYSRYAKSIVVVDKSKNSQGYDRILGQTLEIVPEKNPFFLSEKEKMSFLIYFKGEPVEGMLVRAVNKRNPNQILRTRTDSNGRAYFQIDQEGVWLISGVHMMEALDNVEADWESFWASLTFEVPEI